MKTITAILAFTLSFGAFAGQGSVVGIFPEEYNKVLRDLELDDIAVVESLDLLVKMNNEGEVTDLDEEVVIKSEEELTEPQEEDTEE